MQNGKLVDLSTAIYDKFFAEAKRRGIMWTMQDWAESQLTREIYSTESEYELQVEILCENFEHAEAIKELLAYEISIFVYRRLNGSWGELVDFFISQRNIHCNEYREKTGYQLVGNEWESLF